MKWILHVGHVMAIPSAESGLARTVHHQYPLDSNNKHSSIVVIVVVNSTTHVLGATHDDLNAHVICVNRKVSRQRQLGDHSFGL